MLQITATNRHLLVLGSAIGVYIVSMTIYSIMRYDSFLTNAFDFGIFNQAFWSTVHGRLLYETPDQARYVASGNFLGIHFAPILFILTGIYWIIPSPESLLVIQSVFLGAAAVPIYLIAKHVIKDGAKPLVISLIYLINPMIQATNIADFHLEAFFPFFFSFFVYSLLKQKWRSYAISLVLTLFTIDFAAVLVSSTILSYLIEKRLPIRAFLREKTTRILLLSLSASAAYFFAAIQASIDFAGKSTSMTVQGILSGFFIQSVQNDYLSKITFWVLVFSLFGFLPLLTRSCLLAISPWIIVSAVAIPAFYSLGWQYGGLVIPVLFVGFIRGYNELQGKIAAKKILYFMVVMALLISPLNPLTRFNLVGEAYDQWFPVSNAHTQVLHDAVSLIPSAASVFAQSSLFSQVSNRFSAFVYLPGGTFPDFVFADTKDPTYAQQVWGQSMSSMLPLFLANGTYAPVVLKDGVVLIEKGYTGRILIAGETSYLYNYVQLSLGSGHVIPDPGSYSKYVLTHLVSDQQNGTFWYGPYSTLPPGAYHVIYRMMVSNNAMGSIRVDVSHFFNHTFAREISSATISASEFVPNTWENFTLQFHLTPEDSANGSMEFKGINVVGGTFSLDYLTVDYVGGAD